MWSPARSLAPCLLALLLPASVAAQAAPASPDPAAAPALAPAPPPDSGETRGALQFFFGPGWFSLGKLNDQLNQAGYGSLGASSLVFGGHSHAIIGRLMLGGGGGYFRSSSSVAGFGDLRASYSGGWGGFEPGAMLVDTEHFGLAAVLTVGGYSFNLQAGESNHTEFGAALARPIASVNMTEGGFLLGAALPMDFRVPTRAGKEYRQSVLIGVRPGFLYGFQRGEWQNSGRSADGGPRLGLTGGFVAISIGAGGG